MTKTLLGLAIVMVMAFGELSAAQTKDYCIDCHSNPDFLVTSKKLYDYFKDWNVSIHKQEEVTCSDCHGGNPESADKNAAHGGKSGTTKMNSAVNFANIPNLCGECHDDILEGYLKSNHFKYLKDRKLEKQGPNCVTCHGSLNATALNVNTVKNTCQICHNSKTGNKPEIPEKAEWLLNKFLAIHRLFRYVSIKSDPVQNREYIEKLDLHIKELSEDWHRFDLADYEKKTRDLLDSLKLKRKEVRKRKAELRKK